MGKTTSGQGTSENRASWIDTYNRFFKMFNSITGPVPFHLKGLYDRITKQQPDPVAGALDYLDKYYDEIESFLNDARSSSSGATSAGRQELARTVDYLSYSSTLSDYGIAVGDVLRSLDSIATKANDYVKSLSSSSSKLSTAEIAVKDLLATIKSISENVKSDFAAEVEDWDWVGYKSARRQSLNAIAGIT